VALALEPGEAWYVPLRSPEPDRHLDLDAALPLLRPLLEDGSIAKTGHDLKLDLSAWRQHGVRLARPAFDTMVASYVVDATRSSHRLDVLALALVGHTCLDRADVVGRGRHEKRLGEVAPGQVLPWAAERADVALRLRAVLEPRIECLQLARLFHDVEMPLVEVLAEMEWNGIRVDPVELERQRARLGERIEALRRQISGAAPHPFNPDSPRQLAAALFNKRAGTPPGLGLPVQRRGKTGPSTDVEVLERLAADPRVDSPVPGLIVEYRQLTKLVSTYLTALASVINPRTGRVHASFHQTGTATGRLSSSDPNLQNIPIRTEVGREIRRAFTAEPGRVLLTADYSQIELRLLAHLSEDPALIEAFQRGADIHTAVAAEVFHVDPAQVTPEQRHTAKMVNFGIVYGITPWGLARRLGPDVAVEAAAGIIAGYKQRYARIDAFLARCIDMAVTAGYVETILGRRRAIPQIQARSPQQRALGERMAINSVVQGSAADLIKLAMIDLHRALPERFAQALLVLQIHDELVFEVPRGEVEDVRAFVVQRMQGALRLRVELVVETAWSACWVDA
jgi:DNA polymerase-1